MGFQDGGSVYVGFVYVCVCVCVCVLESIDTGLVQKDDKNNRIALIFLNSKSQ